MVTQEQISPPVGRQAVVGVMAEDEEGGRDHQYILQLVSRCC